MIVTFLSACGIDFGNFLNAHFKSKILSANYVTSAMATGSAFTRNIDESLTPETVIHLWTVCRLVYRHTGGAVPVAPQHPYPSEWGNYDPSASLDPGLAVDDQDPGHLGVVASNQAPARSRA